MKLLAKTNIYYILFSILAFMIGGVIFYSIISADIFDEIDENLLNKKELIEAQLKKKDSLPDFNNAFDSHINVVPAEKELSPQFIDTSFFSNEEKEDVEYRTLVFTEKFQNNIYKFTVSKSIIESEDLVQGIVVSLLLVFFILIATLIIFNYFISKKIWVPFYRALQSIEKFDVSVNKNLELSESKIAEFRKLNATLIRMTSKLNKDFILLKEFTENASHELQTPLAIIKSKLELFIQKEGFTDDQAAVIREIYESVNRLSKLNHALLLITKIENQQFPKQENVNIAVVLKKHLKNFEELMDDKKIELSMNTDSSVRISINPLLLDLLLSNLLSNAIRHNISGGKISVVLNNSGLTIENTGPELRNDPSELFNRFRKDKQNTDSLGLGLSIVKKIAESSGMQIGYTYNNNNMHSLKLVF